jgi:hypothetical protein
MLMIERPNALRDAVVAFSALIYSMKIDRSARVLAWSNQALIAIEEGKIWISLNRG